jgi:hypothetical protein
MNFWAGTCVTLITGIFYEASQPYILNRDLPRIVNK